MSRTRIGAATESSEIFWLVAGTGALEREQQEAFGATATLAVLSSMFIWPHCDCVCGVVHSAILEEKRAHADRGTGPSPAMLNANAKMSARRTATQFSREILPNTPSKVSSFTLSRAVRLVTSMCAWITRRGCLHCWGICLRIDLPALYFAQQRPFGTQNREANARV